MPKSKFFLYGLHDFLYLQHPSPEPNQKLNTELEKSSSLFLIQKQKKHQKSEVLPINVYEFLVVTNVIIFQIMK